MLISGIQKFTLLDYPDKTACIVFTPGCNFRCGYCHNPEFVLPDKIVEMKKSFIPEKAFWTFLQSRVGERVISTDVGANGRSPLLDGVVISGGEPTMQGDLIPFIQKIKQMGFLVKLDTNGNKPEVLKKLYDLKLLDYVAMDVKTDLENYRSVGGPLADENKISLAIKTIKNSGVPYEFRTTLVKELHNYAILEKMGELVGNARAWYLQAFRPACTLSPAFADFRPFSDEEMVEIVRMLKKLSPNVVVR